MLQKKIVYYKSGFPRIPIAIVLFLAVCSIIFFAFFGFLAFVFFSVLAIVSAFIRKLNPFKSKKVNNYDPSTDTYTLDDTDYEVLDNKEN